MYATDGFSNMELIIREMEAGEAKAVQALGIKCFLRSFEGAYVPRPKTACIALMGGEVVGGFLYALESCGKKKLGIIDFFFVDPKHAGQGIGRALCKEGVSQMWAEGCDYLATFVRDDNVGSWSAFQAAGLKSVSLPKVYLSNPYGGLNQRLPRGLSTLLGFLPLPSLLK